MTSSTGSSTQAIVSTAFIDLITADLHDPRVAPLGIRFRDVVARLRRRASVPLGHVGEHVEVEDVDDGDRDAGDRTRADRPRASAPTSARRARALFRAAFAPR